MNEITGVAGVVATNVSLTVFLTYVVVFAVGVVTSEPVKAGLRKLGLWAKQSAADLRAKADEIEAKIKAGE